MTNEKYENLIEIDAEDVYVTADAERIPLSLLYYEEQQENLKLEQNNFSMCNSMYNGKQDINGDY